ETQMGTGRRGRIERHRLVRVVLVNGRAVGIDDGERGRLADADVVPVPGVRAAGVLAGALVRVVRVMAELDDARSPAEIRNAGVRPPAVVLWHAEFDVISAEAKLKRVAA